MDVVAGGARSVASSTAPPAASSTAMTAPRGIAWSYEPSPPRRRGTAANSASSDEASGDGWRAIDARVDQLMKMSRLMRVLSDGGA